jgi:hypothetical protein
VFKKTLFEGISPTSLHDAYSHALEKAKHLQDLLLKVHQAPLNEQEAASKQPSGIFKKDRGRGRRRYKSSIESNTKRKKTS